MASFPPLRRLGLVLLMLLAAGCAREELYVVLPNAESGTGAGAITVVRGEAATTLDKPYAAAELRGGQPAAVQLAPDDARVIFNQALYARPILPRHFRLYFLFDSDALTPDSVQAYRGVFEDIRQRPVYEVEVIGHTDTVGTQPYNQRLSLARAAAIRDRLVADGLTGGAILTAGRGKLDLLVPTADQVPEQRNRRVEITVR